MFLSLFQFIAIGTALIVSHSWAQEPPAAVHPSSQWVAASWEDLPQAYEDNPREALGAWLASCASPQAAWRLVCNELAALKNADAEVLRIWLQARLQPYRVVPLAANPASDGLLTGYYEPIFKAKRSADERYRYPLLRLPAALVNNKSLIWFTREEIDQRRDLQHQALGYLDDPMDVLALHIQGSGQLDWVDDDRVPTTRSRLAFAGTNNHPYKSVGAWLRDTHGERALSWPAIRAWAQKHPGQLNALIWSNPRVVFFKEEALPRAVSSTEPTGPRGAAGVALTAGRSIAVDPQSIPYGTPVWLSSSGDSLHLSRLVIAQDTGAAIQGAIRADYFVGSGAAAGEIAGRLKQPLQLWVLWPK